MSQIFHNPFFLCFILFGILVSIPNTMNNTFVSLYITELGGSKIMIGLAVFLSSILEMGVLLLCNYFLRRRIQSCWPRSRWSARCSSCGGG